MIPAAALVGSGQLEAKGDIKRWRYSEVRLPGERVEAARWKSCARLAARRWRAVLSREPVQTNMSQILRRGDTL
jgi:hypothetical protein